MRKLSDVRIVERDLIEPRNWIYEWDQPRPVGYAFTKSGIQSRMLVNQAVIPDASVHVDESWPERRQESLLAVVTDLFQVDEMRSYHRRMHRVVITQLDFYPLT